MLEHFSSSSHNQPLLKRTLAAAERRSKSWRVPKMGSMSTYEEMSYPKSANIFRFTQIQTGRIVTHEGCDEEKERKIRPAMGDL